MSDRAVYVLSLALVAAAAILSFRPAQPVQGQPAVLSDAHGLVVAFPDGKFIRWRATNQELQLAESNCYTGGR
jgi:hypothetical protein